MIQHAYHTHNYGTFCVGVHETKKDGITTSVSVSVNEAGATHGASMVLCERISEAEAAAIRG